MGDEKKFIEECPCELKIVDGHLEAECATKAAQQLLAELLEKEVIIRVKAKVLVT